ncbi:enolase [Morus notabilis]|uniref:enolase n=1 Tax=Morus notabilis TaxID=981085 RepID=UPI000CED5A68|nr:enolase [Morus notabilis]
MVHLVIHLPEEAIRGGPVHLRWMYPFEHFLGSLKKYVKNRAHPEGSIAEAYIVNEAPTFCSLYLTGIDSRFNRLARNWIDDEDRIVEKISVFDTRCRPIGKMPPVTLDTHLREKAEWCVLHNCPEIQQFIDDHRKEIDGDGGIIPLDEIQSKEFPKWFKNKAVEYVNTVIAPTLIAEDPTEQAAIDNLVIQKLDRTLNKWGWDSRKLGANAVLAVSIAVCKAGAHVKGIPLYRHISNLAGNTKNNLSLPVPAFNAIKHATHACFLKSSCFYPLRVSRLLRLLRWVGTVYYDHIQAPFLEEYGRDEIKDHDEGSLSPNIQVFIGVDMAASGSDETMDKAYKLSLLKEVSNLRETVNVMRLGETEDDFIADLCVGLGADIIKIGVPINHERLKMYNQVFIGVDMAASGSDETMDKAYKLSLLKEVSNLRETVNVMRLGETEDDFIADLCVGLGADIIKIGVPINHERLKMYNQLLQIECDFLRDPEYV